MAENSNYPDQTCKRLNKPILTVMFSRQSSLITSPWARGIYTAKKIKQPILPEEIMRERTESEKKTYNSSSYSWIARILSRILWASANFYLMLIWLLIFSRLLSLFLLAQNACVQQKVITDKVMNEKTNENTEIK